MRYDIYNPTQARRVIYDGTRGQHKVQIDPGQTRHGIELAEHIAAEFGDGRDGDRTDLWVLTEGAQVMSVQQQPQQHRTEGSVALAPPPPIVEDEICPHCGKNIHDPVDESVPEIIGEVALPSSYTRYQAPPILDNAVIEAPKKRRGRPPKVKATEPA